MSMERNRKLTPLQMEQFIIHLKAEIDKYKNKTDEYKKVVQKSHIQDVKEQNSFLEEEVEQLKSKLREQEKSHHSLKTKNEKLQSEILGYQIHISELKNEFESAIQELKEQLHDLTNTESKLQSELQELRKRKEEKMTTDQHTPNQATVEHADNTDDEDVEVFPVTPHVMPLTETNWVHRQLNMIGCSPQNRKTPAQQPVKGSPDTHTLLSGKVDPFRHLRK